MYLDETPKKPLPGHALPPSPYQDANGGPAWQAAIEIFWGSLSLGTKIHPGHVKADPENLWHGRSHAVGSRITQPRKDPKIW